MKRNDILSLQPLAYGGVCKMQWHHCMFFKQLSCHFCKSRRSTVNPNRNLFLQWRLLLLLLLCSVQYDDDEMMARRQQRQQQQKKQPSCPPPPRHRRHLCILIVEFRNIWKVYLFYIKNESGQKCGKTTFNCVKVFYRFLFILFLKKKKEDQIR